MEDGGLACSLVQGACHPSSGRCRCSAQAERFDDSGGTTNGLETKEQPHDWEEGNRLTETSVFVQQDYNIFNIC